MRCKGRFVYLLRAEYITRIIEWLDDVYDIRTWSQPGVESVRSPTVFRGLVRTMPLEHGARVCWTLRERQLFMGDEQEEPGRRFPGGRAWGGLAWAETSGI